MSTSPSTTSNAEGDGGSYCPSPPPLPFSPFHLVEITLVSAQDLFNASSRSSMRTYAVASIGGLDSKFRTSIDPLGHTNPKWNDKHLFRVDDATLRSETSAITVDIYAVRSGFLPGADTLLGTARALLSALQLTTTQRFIALQVRRPSSLRPQGILNLGAAVIDPHAKSAPPRKERKADRPAVPKPANAGCVAPPKPGGGGISVAPVKMVRSKSMKMLEKKLEMWRVELPLAEAEERAEERKRKERKERREAEAAAEAAAKAISRRTTGRKSCFCIEPETEESGRLGH